MKVKHVMDIEELSLTPPADGACVFFCPDPTCRRPHIALFDDNQKPLLQYVVSEEFFAALQNAMKKGDNVH